MCKISVITSVYNGEKYIAETIESIIGQTFGDWEYLIFDNASEDRSAEIVASYAEKDARIRLIRNERNLGQYENLRRGLSQAGGEFIAITDADDISYPTRLEKQLAYMEEHPSVNLLGCQMDYLIDGKRREGIRNIYPSGEAETRFSALFGVLCPHSSFFIRKSALEEFRVSYRPAYRYAGDYALIIDLLRIGQVCVLPERLISYRMHTAQWSNQYDDGTKLRETVEIQLRCLENVPEEYRAPLKTAILRNMKSVEDVRTFCRAFVRYANLCGIEGYEGTLASRACVCQCFRSICVGQEGSLTLLREYLQSPLKGRNGLMNKQTLALIKRCVLHQSRAAGYDALKDLT